MARLRLRPKHASAALLGCIFMIFCLLALRGGLRLTTEDNGANPFSRVTLSPWKDPGDFGNEASSLLQEIDTQSVRAGFQTVSALTSLLPLLREVPRMKTPSAENFIQHIASVGLPVILTDMFDGTRLRRWTWKHLHARFGDVVFHNTRQGEYFDTANQQGKLVRFVCTIMYLQY